MKGSGQEGNCEQVTLARVIGRGGGQSGPERQGAV